MKLPDVVEFKVVEVNRYIVTRYQSGETYASCGPVGMFDNREDAENACDALQAKSDWACELVRDAIKQNTPSKKKRTK